MTIKLTNLSFLDILHTMLQNLNPDSVEPQSGQKTIYRFENNTVILSVYDSTGSCQFQGSKGEKSETAQKIIDLINGLNNKEK